ncbi:hypothetical protein B296_00036464 [Ensete ventricosum]|uniref:14-3-3 domain-containing protein n=1 Tax=Ensete ventricosum TaxID=4639 RepID=A0A427A2E0_ENSVE|nr:hypothetical protein B296_00036464 [Ensete ventricosum]
MDSCSETLTREQFVYLAKLAEQAERYDEMAGFMEKLAREYTPSSGELTVEERNLCSVAYKNLVGARRASWRIISSIEQKEEGRRNEDHAAHARAYRTRVEAELWSICGRILALLDSHLVPSAATSESKVFYLKMKGDYHRYIAEFKAGEERKAAADDTMSAYKAAQAFEEAIAELDSLGEESYKDSALIMQLLRDNLTLWTCDAQEQIDEA